MLSIDVSDNEVGLISPAVLHTDNDNSTFRTIVVVARKVCYIIILSLCIVVTFRWFAEHLYPDDLNHRFKSLIKIMI